VGVRFPPRAPIRNRPRAEEIDSGAETALTLRDGDEHLRKTFEDANLDPRNPAHWAEVARAFANVLFGSRKPGRRRRWTNDELSQFLKTFYPIKDEHPKWSDLRVCEKLVKDHGRYAKLSAETLRRRLQDALGRDKNELKEKVFTDRDVKEWLDRRRRRGRGLKGIVAVREIMLHELVDGILSGWSKLERKRGPNSRSRK
jgi:hypothetical protein